MSWLIPTFVSELTVSAVNLFLYPFQREIAPEEAWDHDRREVERRPVVVDPGVAKRQAISGAIDGENWDELEKLYLAEKKLGKNDTRYLTEFWGQISAKMLSTDEGRKALAARPVFGGAVLAAADPASLRDIDLNASFGQDVLAESMLAMAGKIAPNRPVPKRNAPVDRNTQCDPELFSVLATKVTPDTWNDKGVTRERGLGARVCQALWVGRDFDAICDLISHGVDTSRAARAEPNATTGGGVYSGFVQPVQHMTSKCLKNIGILEQQEKELEKPKEERVRSTVELSGFDATTARGARRILKTLEDLDRKEGNSGDTCKAVTLTRWSEVEGSELTRAFKEGKPGTIWGFEDVRLPFVQAAHDSDADVQPLRMMELWEAVEPLLDAGAYEKLLDDPEGGMKAFIDAGEKTLRDGLNSSDNAKQLKFAEIKKDSEKFIANFRKDAESFLREWASQMPKGTFSRAAVDTDGNTRKRKVKDKLGVEREVDLPMSNAAGVDADKFMGGLACKAGLWWAKNEGKPVYYCLDGINIDEAIDYKKVKNKAIEDFLANGDKAGGPKAHEEVITFVEIREILKHWEDLAETVIFVRKGKIQSGDEIQKEVLAWKRKMEEADKAAGRPAAPSMATFTKELNDLDPDLIARLKTGLKGDPDGDEDARKLREADIKERDKDARDIVRKSGYLVKVAKRRPEIVLKYIMSKCGALVTHGLIPKDLPQAARDLGDAPTEAPLNEIEAARDRLLKLVDECNEKFRAPLRAALVRHPRIATL